MPLPETPLLTVDVVIRIGGGIVLIRRRNPPHGWAIPGGFVDRGESCEAAAAREAREETGLLVENLRLLSVYSDPGRDPRFHTCSVVYTAVAPGAPVAADDAKEAAIFTRETIPEDLAFDHAKILADYFQRSRDTSRGDPSKSYGIVLARRHGLERQYLLLKKRGKDLWEFPKGRGEPGETPVEAARREVLEETGLSGLTLWPAFCATGSYERRPGSVQGTKDVFYFLAVVPSDKLVEVTLSTEHEELGWFDPPQCEKRFARDVFRQVLALAEAVLGKAEGT